MNRRRRRRWARFTRDDVLACILVAVVWIAFWLYVGCRAFGVWAAPAPELRVRDGVHTSAIEDLQTIDLQELADLRGAEDWTAPVAVTEPQTVTVTEPQTVTESATTSGSFTDRERYLLLHVMVHEAGNQGVIGQALVGRVVLNRVESSRFPNDIESVLFQPGQFGPESSICRYEPNADSYAALELLENGWDESQGALFFCTTSFSWATYLFTHGGHNFFV